MLDTLVLTGTTEHLALQAGDDARARFTFIEDLTGWTAWVARIKPTVGTGSWDFAFDTSGQASGVIVATLTAAQTTAMYARGGKLEWQFRVTTTTGKRTLMKGNVTVDEDRFA